MARNISFWARKNTVLTGSIQFLVDIRQCWQKSAVLTEIVPIFCRFGERVQFWQEESKFSGKSTILAGRVKFRQEDIHGFGRKSTILVKE